jgi:hypothetical protein
VSASHDNAPECKPDVPAVVVVAFGLLLAQVSTEQSLSAMVLTLGSGLRQLGLLVLAHLLAERDMPYRRRQVVVTCPKCQSPMERLKNLRTVHRYTLLGKLAYTRCRYRCPACGERIFPLDQSLSLKAKLHGHSEELASELVLLCAVMPFAKGCELFERMRGFAVSTRLACALTRSVGESLVKMEMKRAEELWKLRHEQPERFEPTPAELRRIERHERVYVMMDSSKAGIQQGKRGRGAPRNKTLRKQLLEARRKAVRAAKRGKHEPTPPPEQPSHDELADDDSWRDVRALLIFREADLVQTSNKRREIIHRRVIAHVGTKEEWMRLVHMALHEEGVYTAREVVIIADGGNGIWPLFDELLPSTRFRKVVQLLDWYHAASHLWAVGRALKGWKTTAERKACARWVHVLLDDLAEGKVANVVQRLRRLRPRSEAVKDTVRKCIDYLEGHRHRMRYAWCRKKGMLIGSGPVESVHGWVIQARCGLPGMRWSLEGINAMLRLRCSWASGRWDEDFALAAGPASPSDRYLKVGA